MKNKLAVILLAGVLISGNTTFAFNVKKITARKNVHAPVAQKVQKDVASVPQQATITKLDLSFEQAYELMVTNNNGIKAVLEEVKEKRFEKNAAIGEYFPKVGVNSSYMKFNDDITVNTPSIHLPAMLGGGTMSAGPIKLQDQDLWMTNVGATWNIFTGGKILALNAAARAKLEATNEKYRVVANDLTTELVKRYFGLRLAQDVVEVRKQVYDTVAEHLKDAKTLERVGIIPKSERLHAEVAFAKAETEYEASVRDKNVVEEGLKTLIKADNIDLTGVEINPSSLLFVYNEEFAKLDEFKQLAMQNNPKLKQLEAKKKIVQANYRSHVANYSPIVTVFAQDVVASRNLSYQVPTWTVGGTVNWLLFDGLKRENELRAANCLRNEVKYETIDAKNNIQSLVTKKYEELMKYKEQYESTSKSIENATEALRTARIAFNEGIGTSLSVTDAETALSGVKVQRLYAIYNYDATLTELLNTNGSAEEILKYINKSTKEKL